MTSLAGTRARRGGIFAVAAAVLAALAVAVLAVTGPTWTGAAQQRPVQALGSVPGSQGKVTRLDTPGAASIPDFATTVALGINDLGQVVGLYVDAASVWWGTSGGR